MTTKGTSVGQTRAVSGRHLCVVLNFALQHLETHSSREAQRINMDFEKGWDLGDMTFEVDGKNVYVNKGALCMSSKVFTTMFTSEFKEKNSTKIPLPGKKFKDVLLFAKAIHPPFIEINDDNVDILLTLAHEYEVNHVLKMCEKFLMTKLPTLKILLLADQYLLTDLRSCCLGILKNIRLVEMVDHPDFKKLSRDTVRELIKLQAENPLHVSQELIKELTSKPPSIRGLRLSVKYEIEALFAKCMQYVVDTPLIILENEPDFEQLDIDTLFKVLKMKVNCLEIDLMGARVTRDEHEKKLNKIHEIVNYRRPAEDDETDANSASGGGRGTRGYGASRGYGSRGCSAGQFCRGYGSRGGYGRGRGGYGSERHQKGTSKHCSNCAAFVLEEINNVSTAEKSAAPPNTSYTGGCGFLRPLHNWCFEGHTKRAESKDAKKESKDKE